MDSHEAAYLATRSEQLASRTGLSRRDVLKLGAALSVAAGVAQVAPAGAARAATLPPGSPIVKPLPPEWFVNFGTNAEMRWDAVQPLGYKIPNERFFVRDHTATPLIDVRTWQLRVFGSGLEGRAGLSPTTSCAGCRSARCSRSSSVPATVGSCSLSRRYGPAAGHRPSRPAARMARRPTGGCRSWLCRLSRSTQPIVRGSG
jgi:hypothetical protein